MPTWVTRRFVDLAGKLADLYYSRKYGAMARQLGRPAVSPDDKPGFILIQIDGLSHDHLVQAVAAGYMPYLESLLGKGNINVAAWRCGLPSTTPAAQAGIMFGNRFDIPGYRWYEKDRQMAISPRHLDQVSRMYERVSEGRVGILSGGSCYVSIFHGDADLALFTLSTIRHQRFFDRMRGMALLVLFLLSPLRLLRVIWLASVRYFRSLALRVFALLEPLRRAKSEPRVLNPLDVFSPLLYAVADALFTEVQTFGVMLDIYRCVPAIFSDYTGYDEMAHKTGPESRAARRVLRGIDKRIRQIDRMRANYRRREYHLYLVSDHGNTAAIPFSWENGTTLGEHLISLLGNELSLDERLGTHSGMNRTTHYLREELRALEETGSPRLRVLTAPARRFVQQRLRDEEDIDYDLGRQRDVVVSASGPLAHVYFNVSARALDIIEVVLLYPGLLERLWSSPGIGAIIGRAGESTVVLGPEGGTLEIGEEQAVLEEPNPLIPFGDEAYAAAQLHRLAHFPHSGDLIILGDIREDGKVVTFEEQVATHGGLGGPQGHPFIAWSAECQPSAEVLEDAEDLYRHFIGHYQPQGNGEDPAAAE